MNSYDLIWLLIELVLQSKDKKTKANEPKED